MSFKVRIAQADRTIDVPTGATILAAALDAGIGYPFGCQSGNCGACKSHLVKGEVALEGYSEFALSDEEKERGLILACRSVPWEGRTPLTDACPGVDHGERWELIAPSAIVP